MTKSNDGRTYLLVNLPQSVSEAKIASLFQSRKKVQNIVLEHYPEATFLKDVAFVRLSEAVPPHSQLFEFTKIRGAKLDGHAILVIPVFLNKSSDARDFYEFLCTQVGAFDEDGMRKAETIMYKLASMQVQIGRIGMKRLMKLILEASDNGNVDVRSLASNIDAVIAEQVAKDRVRSKKPGRSSTSIDAISTPMGGQPGWKRRG